MREFYKVMRGFYKVSNDAHRHLGAGTAWRENMLMLYDSSRHGLLRGSTPRRIPELDQIWRFSSLRVLYCLAEVRKRS